MSTTTDTMPELVATFPFPFVADQYRYSANVEPSGRTVTTPTGQWGDTVVDVDVEYERELAERERILAADPSRYAVLPHMVPACWDAMLTLMQELATSYPEDMSLRRDGQEFVWRNGRLGIDQRFVMGDADTLPTEPLAYIGSQVQEDLVLLDQRDGDLFADAGLVSFAADWSFRFDVGMTLMEIHGPVPRLRQTGVISRAREFIMRLQPGQPYRRTNWTMTSGRRLDTATELYQDWGPERAQLLSLSDEEFGRTLHLRTEVQHLIRLAGSGAVLFLIRTYMLPIAEVAKVEDWRLRTAAVLEELPEDMADYKGVATYRHRVIDWLRAHPNT